MEAYYEAYYNYDDEYLEHYGIKGMKWGVRRTPEQLGHHIDKQKRKLAKNVAAAKKAKAAGDKEKLKKLNIKSLKLKKDISNSKKELDKINKEEKRKTEEERANFLKTASAEQLYSRRHEFSESQLNTAMKRINMEQTIKSMADKDMQDKIESGRQKIESIMKYADTAAKTVDTFDNVADAVNRIAGKEIIKSTKSRLEEAKDPDKKERQKIVRSGDYNKIMENRQRLTDEEFKNAMARIEGGAKALNAQSSAQRSAASALETSRTEATRISSERETEHNQRRQERESQRQRETTNVANAHSSRNTAEANARQNKNEAKAAQNAMKEAQRKQQEAKKEIKKAEKEIKEYEKKVARGETMLPSETARYNAAKSSRISERNNLTSASLEEARQNNIMKIKNNAAKAEENRAKAFRTAEREASTRLNELPEIGAYDNSSHQELIRNLNDTYLRYLGG